MQLRIIKPRLGRLRELVAELIQEYVLIQSQESPLLEGESRAYLCGIQDALAGVDEASVVLARAIKRLEELGLPMGLL